MHTGFWWGNLRELDHLKDKRRREGNIKMHFQEVRWGSTDWIDLAQDRNWWQALVNVVMNLQVP